MLKVEVDYRGLGTGLRNIIPDDIWIKAERVVENQRPDNIPDDFEPLCMAGLTGEEHGDLNLPVEVYPGGGNS